MGPADQAGARSADERGATDDRPSLSHHRDPVRQRRAASRPCARVRADRRARPSRPRPRAADPLPHRHRRARGQERARPRPRPAPTSRRSWPRTPSRFRALADTLRDLATTTSSAPAPTRVTAGGRGDLAARAPRPATSTARRTGLVLRGLRGVPRADGDGGRCPSTTRRSNASRRRTGSSGCRATRRSSATLIAQRPAAHRARGAPQRGARVPRGRRPRRQRLAAARRASRDWGIPVPGDPEQIIYVWFDALDQLHQRARLRRPTTRCRDGGRRGRARARDRQGHRALPRADLARDPALGRAAAPDRAVRARLRDRGRPQDRQVARQRGRPDRRWSSGSAPTRCAGGCAARFRGSARSTSPRSGWSRSRTATSPTASATSCSARSRSRPRVRRRPGSRATSDWPRRCQAHARRSTPRSPRFDLQGRDRCARCVVDAANRVRRADAAVGAARRPRAARAALAPLVARRARSSTNSSRSCPTSRAACATASATTARRGPRRAGAARGCVSRAPARRGGGRSRAGRASRRRLRRSTARGRRRRSATPGTPRRSPCRRAAASPRA